MQNCTRHGPATLFFFFWIFYWLCRTRSRRHMLRGQMCSCRRQLSERPDDCAYRASRYAVHASLMSFAHADSRDATARKSVSASRAFTLLTSSAKTAAVQPVTTDRTRCTKVEDASGIPRPDPQREKKEQALRSKKSTDDESPGEHQPVPTTQKGRQSGEGEGGPPTGSCEKA